MIHVNTDITFTITIVSLVILTVKWVTLLCVILQQGHVLTDVNKDSLENGVTRHVT